MKDVCAIMNTPAAAILFVEELDLVSVGAPDSDALLVKENNQHWPAAERALTDSKRQRQQSAPTLIPTYFERLENIIEGKERDSEGKLIWTWDDRVREAETQIAELTELIGEGEDKYHQLEMLDSYRTQLYQRAADNELKKKWKKDQALRDEWNAKSYRGFQDYRRESYRAQGLEDILDSCLTPQEIKLLRQEPPDLEPAHTRREITDKAVPRPDEEEAKLEPSASTVQNRQAETGLTEHGPGYIIEKPERVTPPQRAVAKDTRRSNRKALPHLAKIGQVAALAASILVGSAAYVYHAVRPEAINPPTTLSDSNAAAGALSEEELAELVYLPPPIRPPSRIEEHQRELSEREARLLENLRLSNPPLGFDPVEVVAGAGLGCVGQTEMPIDLQVGATVMKNCFFVRSKRGERKLSWEEKARYHAGPDLTINHGHRLTIGEPIYIAPYGTEVTVTRVVTPEQARARGASTKIRRAGSIIMWQSTIGSYVVTSKLLHQTPLVKEGQVVRAGMPIALVATYGKTDGGPHLHYELYIKRADEEGLGESISLSKLEEVLNPHLTKLEAANMPVTLAMSAP